MKNTSTEIEVIDSDGNINKLLIPTLEYFRKELQRISMIPNTFFSPTYGKNHNRRNKITKINGRKGIQ